MPDLHERDNLSVEGVGATKAKSIRVAEAVAVHRIALGLAGACPPRGPETQEAIESQFVRQREGHAQPYVW